MRKLSLLLTLSVISLLVACGNDEESNNQETEGTSEADENTLTVGMSTDIVSFDIHDHNNTATEAVHVNMFNYLIRNDAEEGFVPELAESWENVDDTTWSFTLKEGVMFHNGDELTSDDVKFSIERPASDESLLEHAAYNQIEEVEVIDDHEFLVHTFEPEPILLNRLSRIGSSILPESYIDEVGWEEFLQNP